ncbi:MAG: hypothetical protein J6Y71_02140 [Ruminococcus sp.]|nr:hypothetical protein [Ruminococcus sp.]
MRKNNKKDRRILVGALAVAGVTVAGSTFAWFTSKDEVTNRLSAKAEYNTSIVEDFQPPYEWVPGQTVNKDVSIVNTGNVDALVGVQLSGKLSLVRAAAGTAVTGAATALPEGITTAANYDAVNDTTKIYALELSKNAVAPVAQNNTAGSEANAQGGIANEVTTLQAGGTLIWANGAVKPTDEFSERSGDDAEGATPDYSGANQFTPTKSGVYIFRRNVTVNAAGAESYKYSGYLYVKGATAADDKYYAFETETTAEGATTPYIKDIAVTYNDDGTVASISGLKLATVQKSVIDATLDYTKVADAAPKIVAKDAASGGTIDIDINLNPAYATNWQYVADKGFFYKDDLEEGATTTRLVDSVTLSDTVKNGAYLAMDFDLNVAHESVQVTKDASGNETAPATTIFGATPSATAASELANVSWS